MTEFFLISCHGGVCAIANISSCILISETGKLEQALQHRKERAN
jgi:hypothetical protein